MGRIIKLTYDMIKRKKKRDGEYMTEKCDACNGNRLKPSSQSVLLQIKYSDILNIPIEDAHAFFKMIKF